MRAGLFAPLTALLLLCAAAPAHPSSGTAVPGEKLDSGLGALPHYSHWKDPSGRAATAVRVPGESLDSGLGELPSYSQWKDPTGRDPLGRRAPQGGVAMR
jgi:hypothetical protein